MKKAKKQLNKVLCDGDLQAIGDLIGGLLDKQSAVLRVDLSSKKDLKNTEYRIKSELTEYMNQGFEAVMNGIDNVAATLAEKKRVENLEKWALAASQKIGIKNINQ